MPTYEEFLSNPAIAYNMITNSSSSSGGSMPSGAIIMWGGASIPSGWLLCNGQSTSGYADLAAVVGGNVPDLRDKFIIGAGSGYAVGNTGGAATKSLSSGELAAHTHTGPSHTHTTGHVATAAEVGGYGLPADDQDVAFEDRVRVNRASGSGGDVSDASGTGATGSTGSGTAFSILPPYYALSYIIKT